ncbi:MAG: hypothetical protein WBD28_04120 [Candidatus Zixiibacteriota bacterium]
MKKVRCKFCDHEWDEDVEEIWEQGKTIVMRSLLSDPSPLPRPGEKCVNLKCKNPECKRMFEFCWED